MALRARAAGLPNPLLCSSRGTVPSSAALFSPARIRIALPFSTSPNRLSYDPDQPFAQPKDDNELSRLEQFRYRQAFQAENLEKLIRRNRMSKMRPLGQVPHLPDQPSPQAAPDHQPSPQDAPSQERQQERQQEHFDTIALRRAERMAELQRKPLPFMSNRGDFLSTLMSTPLDKVPMLPLRLQQEYDRMQRGGLLSMSEEEWRAQQSSTHKIKADMNWFRKSENPSVETTLHNFRKIGTNNEFELKDLSGGQSYKLFVDKTDKSLDGQPDRFSTTSEFWAKGGPPHRLFDDRTDNSFDGETDDTERWMVDYVGVKPRSEPRVKVPKYAPRSTRPGGDIPVLKDPIAFQAKYKVGLTDMMIEGNPDKMKFFDSATRTELKLDQLRLQEYDDAEGLSFKKRKDRSRKLQMKWDTMYIKEVWARSKSRLGVQPLQVKSMRGRLMAGVPVSDSFMTKYTANLASYMRAIILIRIWLYDAQTLQVMEAALDHLATVWKNDRDLRDKIEQAITSRGGRSNKLTNLRNKFNVASKAIKSTNRYRHVEVLVEHRKPLFAIAEALQKIEKMFWEQYRVDELPPTKEMKEGTRATQRFQAAFEARTGFLSTQLRYVERNLRLAEELAYALIGRKVLIEGPKLSRLVSRELVKLKLPNIPPIKNDPDLDAELAPN
ncbi:hypothetical protein F4808DRAFT_432600, partial [Astrocystis sublimbata]